MINYDPDGVPKISSAVMEQGRQLGLHPFVVICDEPNGKVGQQAGVSFITFGAFVPRAGERITLEDGTTCQVQRIYYKTSRVDGSTLVALVPNVYAVRISPERSEA